MTDKKRKVFLYFATGLIIPIIVLGYVLYMQRIPAVHREIASKYDLDVDDLTRSSQILSSALKKRSLSSYELSEAKRLLASNSPLIKADAISGLGELHDSPQEEEARQMIESYSKNATPGTSFGTLSALRKLKSPTWRDYARKIIESNDEGAIEAAKKYLEKGDYVPKN